MKRRTFLSTALAATCTPVVLTHPSQSHAAANRATRQFFELRRYECDSTDQQQRVLSFLGNALVPALARLKIAPVGVFTMLDPAESSDVFQFTPFDSLDQVAAVTEQLASDDTFLSAAESYLNTSKAQPAYRRIKSSLMVAFSGMPNVEIPRTGERFFELRTYESHNELKAHLKVEMFNDGEFSIFRKVGLDPVFFGQTLVGENQPNLTYMLAFRDMEEHDAAWKAFIEHPDWLELKQLERYQDTVSKIHKHYLKPAECSQI